MMDETQPRSCSIVVHDLRLVERLCRLIAVNLFNDKDQVLTMKYSDYDKFIILEVT